MRVIPAIDLLGGRCVRLEQGDYEKETIYREDPVEQALYFEDQGFEQLHLVDLDGARNRPSDHLEILAKIASRSNLIIDFGGGMKSAESVEAAFTAGASKVTVGSLAVTAPDTVVQLLATVGADKLILGADVRGEQLCINGWLEESKQDIFSFLRFYQAAGMRQVICTDIARDGMLKGPSLALYRKLKTAFPTMELIASGGVGQPDDLNALYSIGIHQAIVGKALYEQQFPITKWR